MQKIRLSQTDTPAQYHVTRGKKGVRMKYSSFLSIFNKSKIAAKTNFKPLEAVTETQAIESNLQIAAETFNDIDLQITQASIRYTRRLIQRSVELNNICKKNDLKHLNYYYVLCLLYSGSSVTVGQIADELGLARSHASEILTKMAGQKLLYRARGIKDKRKQFIKLTNMGVQKAEAILMDLKSLYPDEQLNPPEYPVEG